MAFFSEELAPMLGTYQGETSALMEIFDNIAAKGIQTNTFSPEEIAELFRTAHTIKSSSAAMGLSQLSELTHHMEDLLSIFRAHPERIEGHVDDLIGHFFDYSDFVKKEIGRMQENDYEPADPNGIYEQLTQDIARFQNNSASETGPLSDDPAEETDGEIPAFSLPHPRADQVMFRLTFQPGVMMISARAMVIERQLSKICHIDTLVPAKLDGENTDAFLTKQGLYLTLPAAEEKQAKAFLDKNLYLKNVEVISADAAKTAAIILKKPAKPAERQYSMPSGKEKFISLRWDDIHELQNIGGIFLTSASKLRLILQEHEDMPELKEFSTDYFRMTEEFVMRLNAMTMMRVSMLVPQLNRMVWDMCRDSGKEIDFEVHGQDMEIDRNLYNNISEPLMHMIRNAVDHGIESKEERLAQNKSAKGRIVLAVENQGTQVVFRVSDNGRGMNYRKILEKAERENRLDKPAADYSPDEAFRLIMKAGFSTSKTITRYSGRGVGMDVVNNIVSEFGGTTKIKSEPGKGTAISMIMPVSVTAVESLGFRIGNYTCVLPLHNIDAVLSRDEAAELLVTDGEERSLAYEKQEIPILDLHTVFGAAGEERYFLIVHSLEHRFCITADDVTGQETASSQPLPRMLDDDWQTATAIRNGVIHADGSIGFVLNAALLSLLIRRQRGEDV